MNFIPLHLYSGYTFLGSGILFDKLIKSLKDKNYKVCGLTDLNVMHGYPSFDKACLASSIRPIFGLDLYINEELYTLFVKDEKGYKNLCQISTFLEKRAGICKDFSEIKNFLSDLICVASTKNSTLFNRVNDALFKDKILKIKDLFDDFYIGLEIYNVFDKNKAALIREFSGSYDIPCIAFPFIKYLDKKDRVTLQILTAISKETGIETIEDDISDENYLRSSEEIEALYDFKDIKELNNLVDKINFSFNVKRGELLHFAEGKNISSKDLLKEKIYEGLAKHNIDIKTNKPYKDRLNHEFMIIDKMGYCDYFLIVQDYVKYAKDNDIPVGPGRGSAAGSLISYLLNITEIDPLKFDDLLFERFLNPERESMPDIDIDFSDLDRDKVIDYIVKKYGTNRTARVIAFQTIGAKQAIRDVGRVFHYPQEDIEQLSKAIPATFKQGKYDLSICEKEIPAFRNLLNDPQIKEIVENAKLIEGFPRQKGLHAAGVIINNKSLFDCLPLTTLDDDQYVTQFEKEYLEDQGFLKMDLLGLTALSTIQRTLDLIKQHRNIDIKIVEIPYDDPAIYKLIREGKTMGIFQLDTGAAAKGISYIQPESFNDIVDLLALDRPGPQEQIPLYSDRKHGKYKTTYIDKSLVPVLKNTYGIIIYQEQIMQIARLFAGFSYAEADIFRRAVSKKHKSELLMIKEKFVIGAKKKGHKDETIEQIYNLILKFASYGFNKSHSVAYSVVSCRMAYLKAYYPLEFYCSILESQYGSSSTKFSNYVSEIKRNNTQILNPDINKSEMYFKIYEDKLLMPLTNIGGLPSKFSFSIIQDRNTHGEYESFIDFVIRMTRPQDKVTDLQLNKLIDAGCFDNMNPNRKQLKESTHAALQYANTMIFNETNLFGNFGLTFQYPDVEDDKKEAIKNEFNVLGICISDSLFNYVELPENVKITDFHNLVDKKKSTIFGMISNIKTITTKKGEPMAFLTLVDDTMNTLSITLFNDVYAQYSTQLDVDKFVLINGHLDIRKTGDRPSFVANEIQFITEKPHA